MSRNAVYQALFALGSAATLNGSAAFAESSRRLKSPDQCQFPAFFQVEPLESFTTVDGRLKKRELDVIWFVYHNAGTDQSAIPASNSADLMDALEAALAPPCPGAFQTLGGLAYSACLSGQVKRWDGDLDGISILMIPVKVTLP